VKRLGSALQIFFRFFPSYAGVILLLYAPWMLGLKLLAANGVLSADAGDALAGLLSIFFMPVANGMIVWLNHQHAEGAPAAIPAAFTAALPRGKDLISAYISVGFVMLGWLAVALLPAGLVMLVFGLKSLYWLIPSGVVAVIYVMARYVFLDFFIMLRGEAGWSARRHSPELTRGRLAPIGVAVTLMSAPLMLSEFGFNSVAIALESMTGVSMHLFVGVLSLTSTLLYIVPQIYFYLLYREIT
jgi:hypothetical protein